MGMQLPDLDNTTFEKLLEEARLLIGRYTPDWTDHNIHDPGITFIELFAWLAEMQIYRLNRLTDAQYQKFLQLSGITLTDVIPASVRVAFKPENLHGTETIAAGTPIHTEMESQKIHFEVTEKVTLSPLVLQSVNTLLHDRTIDNTSANETGEIYFYAFGEKARVGSQLQLTFDKNLSGREIHLAFDLRDEPGSSFVTLVWEYREGINWIPFNIKKDTTASFSKSGKVVFTGPPATQIRCRLEKGHYEIAPAINGIMLNTLWARQLEQVDKELGKGNGFPNQEFTLDKTPVIGGSVFYFPMFRIDDILDWCAFLNILQEQAASNSPSPGRRIYLELTNEVRCMLDKRAGVSLADVSVPGVSVPDVSLFDLDQKRVIIAALNRVLLSGNLYDEESFRETALPGWLKTECLSVQTMSGSPLAVLNRFLIEAAYPGHIAKNRLVAEVQREDGEWREWVKVFDFQASGPRDPHYMYDHEAGKILFGNGLNGLIPRASQRIRVAYKTTLGSGGNVPKDHIFKLERVAGTNPEAAFGGREAETVKEGAARARKDFNTTYRAITSQDYETLALETPGVKVARAKALANYNPQFPCIRNFPGTVTVVVVPGGGAEDSGPPPVPGDGFLKTVHSHLNPRRLVTTDVFVIGPQYQTVSVSCRVKLKKKSSPQKVKDRVLRNLNEFLHPLKGGPEKKGRAFGRSVYPSEIYQLIDNLEGVDYAFGVVLETDKKKYAPGHPLKIAGNTLVFPGEHQVEVI
ncbi:MAG: putative baseplate assembly protein [bacterium]|nr:putative baseplate assembly protein [bacterium]